MPKKNTTRKSKKVVKRQAAPTNISDYISENISRNDIVESDIDYKINHHYNLTYNQQAFLDSIELTTSKMSIADGPAGTAKTYIAVLAALNLLQKREVDNIVYIRSIVESASRNLGSLPGELEEKFAPWSMPLIDKLDELIPSYKANNLLSKGYIKCVPVNFTRGLTFRNSCVIIDEAQNLTLNELTTILTRFGNNSRYVVIGDTLQSDINGKSGFGKIYDAFDHESCIIEGISAFKFSGEDIVRSKILRFIVDRLGHIE